MPLLQKPNMYYRPYRRDERRLGRRVVVAVISALITAGVLYAYFTRLTAGAGGERLETVVTATVTVEGVPRLTTFTLLIPTGLLTLVKETTLTVSSVVTLRETLTTTIHTTSTRIERVQTTLTLTESFTSLTTTTLTTYVRETTTTTYATTVSRSPIVINEVELNPKPGLPEWIELYNPNDYAVNVSGYKIYNGIILVKTIPHNALVPARGYLVVEMPMGDFLPNNNACIILRDDFDRYVDSTPCLQGGGLGDLFSNDYTWSRVPDGSNVWMFQTGTPGRSNV